MIIKGKLTSNCKLAGKNIAKQKPFFTNLPDMDDLHDGTINIDISPDYFQVCKHDYAEHHINWTGNGPEDFLFIRITGFGMSGKRENVKGYLYLPLNSPNKIGGRVLEVWTEYVTFIDSLNDDDILEIELPDGMIGIL